MIEQLLQTYPGAAIGSFGDSEELSAELIALVRSGQKTATCAALRDYEAEGEPLPEIGQYEIVLDATDTPVLVLKTLWVEIKRFADVDWGFAKDEGEDDTLDSWRRNHRAFFERNGGFDPDMLLVCQRFSVAQDLLAD